MDAMPQVPFGQSNLFLNPDRRCPCVLLLDTSYSMRGDKIDQLNLGIEALQRDLSSDLIALKRVEIAVVTFGPVKVAQPFTTIDRLSMPRLVADNDTPMGEAILKALDLLADRKRDYQAAGVPYFKAQIWLLSDGAATDDLSKARVAVKKAEASNSINFFAVGVEGADLRELSSLSSRPALPLKGLAFVALLEYVSASLRITSRSAPGSNVPLPNPSGWADIRT
jgi:uncharacterized protein YegL